MPGGGDPVGGGVKSTDDGRGTHLPGEAEGTGAVQRVQVGDGDGIIGEAQDNTAWASGRGEMELENLGQGEEVWTYRMAFPAKGGPRSFPVEVFPRRAATRTDIRVHSMHRHVLDTVVTLEEGNIPHPRCLRCDILVP